MGQSYHTGDRHGSRSVTTMAYRKNPIVLDAERRMLVKLRRELKRQGGHRARTAKALGISERQIYRLIQNMESQA